MAVLPTLTRIQKEDLGQNVPNYIANILAVMNQFMEEIYNSYNKNLTLNDNISSQIKTLDITTVSTYSTGTFTEIKFSSSLKNRMSILLVGQVIQEDDPSVKYNYCFPSWVDNNGLITIRYISGLSNSKKYKITFLGF
jgi:hypothetical protein